jgi:glycosyltransferase involved in cell wall biosynthesis
MSTEMAKPRLIVLWRNFGPYHYGRLNALRKYFDAQGIQIVARTGKHLWHVEGEDTGMVHDLFETDEQATSPLKVSMALWRALSKINPEILMIPSYSPYPAWVCLLWGLLHRKTRILMTESNEFDSPRRPRAELFKKLLVKFYSGGVVGGTTARDYLENLGMPGERIADGYDCVDGDSYEQAAARARADEAGSRRALNLPEKYFVCPARLVPEKNHKRLIEAFRLFRDTPEGAEFHLLLCGTGPEDAAIREQIATSQVEGIEMRGFVQMEDMVVLYSYATAMVLPSLVEAWGLVVNEALACGTPVLVSNRAGSSFDLATEKTGWTYSPYSVDEILAAMICAAGNAEKLDRRDLEEASRRYTLDGFAANVSALVKKITAKR